MKLHLQPVYSKLADDVPSELQAIVPQGWQLSAHQVATYCALTNPQYDIVFNTALTGDGKSLAGLLRLLTTTKGWHMLNMYPTNELIRDQLRSIEKLFEHFKPELADYRKQRMDILDSARLDQLEQDWLDQSSVGQVQRGQVLKTALSGQHLVLTNPDIFHLIMQFKYVRFGVAHDQIAADIWEDKDQLTFDEFHLFEVPQVGAILTALMLIHQVKQQQKPFKTLFLSATPDNELQHTLHQAGFAPERIKVIEGEYQHHHPQTPGWRHILQAATLHLSPDDIHTWLDRELVPGLLHFFKTHPGQARGAIILDSVARAQRVYALLKDHPGAAGIDIRLNTGLSRSKAWQDADLVIATSTVDVGVDFAINFLVFEASDSSRFIQRLGRLGRHTSFIDRNGISRAFNEYIAYALLPGFVYNRFADHSRDAPALFADGATVDRIHLQQAVRTAFPSRATFKDYLRDWGRFIPANVVMQLYSKQIRDSYTEARKVLKPAYSAVFGTSIPAAINEWRAAKQQKNQAACTLFEAACSFRGSSSFNCGVLLDTSIEHHSSVTDYDLFWLLANTNISLCDYETFSGKARQRSANLQRFRNKDHFLAYVQVHGLLDSYREVQISLERAEYDLQSLGQAQLIKRISIDCPGFIDANELNTLLRRKSFIATIIKQDVKTARFKLYLPGFFRLLPCRLGDGTNGSIAFDREALLLDSLLRRRNTLGAQVTSIMI